MLLPKKKSDNLLLLVHLVQFVERSVGARRFLLSLQYTKIHKFNPTQKKSILSLLGHSDVTLLVFHISVTLSNPKTFVFLFACFKLLFFWLSYISFLNANVAMFPK